MTAAALPGNGPAAGTGGLIALGLAASVAVHLLVGWALVATLAPERVGFRPEAAARLSVAALETPADRARPAAPDAPAAPQARPAAQAGGVASPPRTRAAATEPTGLAESVAAAAPDRAPTAPATPSSTAIAAVPRADAARRGVAPSTGLLDARRLTGDRPAAVSSAAVPQAATRPPAASVTDARTASPVAPAAAPASASARVAAAATPGTPLSPRAQGQAPVRPVSAPALPAEAATPQGASLRGAVPPSARAAATAPAPAPTGSAMLPTRVAAAVTAPASSVRAEGPETVASAATPAPLRADRFLSVTPQVEAPAAAPARGASVPTTRPDAPTTADTPSTGARTDPLPPPAERPTTVPSGGIPVAATTPPALPTPVETGWSGGADARLAPGALDAIGAFIPPAGAGDAPSVRDGLGTALAALPCSRVEAAVEAESGRIVLRGHVRDARQAETAIAAVAARTGGALPVEPDLMVLPEPHCTVLDTMAALGLPQSNAQADDPLVVGRAAAAAQLRLEEGEPMVFALTGADYEAYFHVDGFDAAGTVTHLIPNEFSPPRRRGVKEAFTIGAPGDGSGVLLEVVPPFGTVVVMVLAATQPVFDTPRPLREDAAGYLAALRARLATLKAADPGFRGEWVYMTLETFARGRRPARAPVRLAPRRRVRQRPRRAFFPSRFARA